MSAIVALYALDGRPIERREIECMLHALRHRGRDGRGVWVDGPIGLGHRMMWTTPESLTERLPSADPASGLVITADARIDNRDELVATLELADGGSECADSELILAAYERWGERCVDHLLGDYAFAIWNPRERTLFCARDPFALKHFYYTVLPGRVFALASEIKALLALPEVPRALNELMVAYHVLPLYDDKVNTFYRDVFRLPADRTMTVGPGGVVMRSSWTPDLGPELRLRSDAEYEEAFRDVFSEAVRCRMRSAFPVGSMLSGGLDSSSVTCLAGAIAASEGTGPIKTFSSVWPSIASIDPRIDERRFMDAVIDRGGFEPHFIYSDRLSPLADWERVTWHEDATLSAPNMYMDWAIFESAHERGVRVLLGGTDGDTVVSYGYEDLRAFASRGRWLRLAREARAVARTMPSPGYSTKHLVWNMGIRPAIPERAKSVWRALRGRRATPEATAVPAYARRRPLNPEFVRRVRLEEELSSLFEREWRTGRSARETHWDDVTAGHWSYILETFEKAGGAHELEVRQPFFDRRVVEFCLSLPPGQKLKNGYTRSILRRAMGGLLPPSVQWRVDKGNLSRGVCVNLLRHERDTLEEIVGSEPSLVGEYLDVPALRAIYERYASDAARREQEAFTLLLATNLGLWLRNAGFAPAIGGRAQPVPV